METLRNECLKELYDLINQTADAEEIERLSRAVKNIEDAQLGAAQIESKNYDVDVRYAIEKAQIEHEEDVEKKRQRMEYIKLAAEMTSTFAVGLLSAAMISWIIEDGHTNAITSKAYQIAIKLLPALKK